ncbi:MAG: lysylphosphatidylglycerol synthase domain-containing protein [Vicinamibacterales bacterium]
MPAAVIGAARPAPSPGRRWLVPAAGAAGILLLGWLVVDLGPARIAAQLKGLGPILPLVLALTFLKYPLQAAGWRLALPADARPSWRTSVVATITGDALGYLTWAGPFTGEPMRAMLIRDRVPVASGIAAGAIERAAYNATSALLVWVVLAFLLARQHPVALAAVTAGSAAGVWWLIRWLRRSPSRAASHAAEGAVEPMRGPRAVLRAMRHLGRDRRAALPAIVALCAAQHAVLVGEAWLMLDALGGDVPVGTALVFEAVMKIVNTVGVVVPGRIGIAEGGSALLAGALGFAAAHGLGLALMRRVRAIIWAGVGLALLPFQEARARRAPSGRDEGRHALRE